MIVQWVLTIIVVAAALIYTLHKMLALFKKPNAHDDGCNGCSSDCNQCPLNMDVTQIVDNNQ